VQTLPIPPARPKKRSFRSTKPRGRGASARERAIERPVVDTKRERTDANDAVHAPAPSTPAPGALVLESLAGEPPRPPAVPDVAPIAASGADARRYVAVVSEVPGSEGFAEEKTTAPRPTGRRSTDRYATDLPILITSALLAGATFIPWYKGPRGFGLSVTGWASGSWGPLIAFLGLGSVALVVLRRLGVSVGLPVEESLLHEGAGWVALVGAVFKSRIRPGSAGLLSASYGVWIAIAAAAILIVLAGRMSPHAGLVLRTGWHKGKAGVIGIVVLGIVVAGSAVFGVTNSPTLQPTGGSPSDLFAGTVRGRMPDCAKGFPLPESIKPQYGFGTGSTCQAQLTSSRPPAEITAAFDSLLRTRGWTFTKITGAPGSTIFTITKPRCATLAVVPAESGSIAAVAFQPCPAPTASR